MPSYDNLNILFSSHYSDEYIKVPDFSSRQVNCGPNYQDKDDGIRSLSVKTPVGQYDIQEIISKLPNNQRPDLVIVKSDATRSNHPINIDSLSIPTLLIIGDTMHQHRPLQTMLAYAKEQQFDYYVADHGKRHLHFFRQLGIDAHWLPGVLIRTWDIPFEQVRDIPISFVGQAGRFHPHRRLLLDKVKNDKFNLFQTRASQKDACLIYAKSQITLNLSMMGDINLRVFEVLSAGGFLITDDISPQAGKDLIFKNGEHLVLFKDYEDLKSKLNYYLENPSEAMAIAEKGYQEFCLNHSPSVKRKQLFDLVFEGKLPNSYDGRTDKRSIIIPGKKQTAIADRVQKYEYLQSIHRIKENLKLIFLVGSDQYLLSDLVDMPRFDLYHTDPPSENLMNAIGPNQITRIDLTNIKNENCSCTFDLAVVSWQTLEFSFSKNYLKKAKIKQVIVANDKSIPEMDISFDIDNEIMNFGYLALRHDGLTVYHLQTRD